LTEKLEIKDGFSLNFGLEFKLKPVSRSLEILSAKTDGNEFLKNGMEFRLKSNGAMLFQIFRYTNFAI
jgi:hypothetical protein